MSSEGLQLAAQQQGEAAHQHASSAPWPEHLPRAAQECIVGKLPKQGRRSLRLVNTAMHRLVDSCATRARFRNSSMIAKYSSAMPQQQAARIVAGAPWNAIKELRFGKALPSSAEAALVLANCPNVETCRLSKEDGTTAEFDSYEIPDSISQSCCTLAAAGRLRALEVSFSYPLGDKELSWLAACPTLTSLRVSLDACGPAGWASLLGMTQLVSLTVQRGAGQCPPGDVQLDLRQLTALTQLCYSGDSCEEQEGFERGAAALAGLQLPSSVVSVTLERMPGPALGRLPQLAILNVGYNTVGAAELNALAGACCGLRSLTVVSLVVDGAAMALRSLTALTVLKFCTVSHDAAFAGTFPKLQSLVLSCECDFVRDVRALEGLQELTQLDISRGPWDPVQDWLGRGLFVPSPDFDVLATLPKLAQLRLNLVSEHIYGLIALTRLESVIWVGQPWTWTSMCRVPKDLAASSPPPQLRSITFEFVYDPPGGAEEETNEMVYTGANVSDQACSWMLRAPLLESVCWRVDGICSTPCTDMTDMRLLALASQPGIKRIDVCGAGACTEACHHLADSVTNSMLRRIVGMYASRGLRLTMHGRTLDEGSFAAEA